MKALSIRQPWAWLICHSGKDIENRSWHTWFRGEVLLHAARGMTRDEYEDCEGLGELPPFDLIERGGIVGVATIVACVTDHPSIWFNGPYGFVLDEVRALPFVPCRGALGFFEVPAGVEADCRLAMARIRAGTKGTDGTDGNQEGGER